MIEEGELNELALFAGGGGGILGAQLIGFRTVCAVENDPKCIEVLLRRQHDGCLPAFPIWDDVRTFDGRPWCGSVDVITGGFPCQDISCAGKGEGITGIRSGLFFDMLRIIEEVRPRFVLTENSPHLRTKGLGAVLTGFARLGYDARWGVLGARHVGANHWRRRLWIVAANAHRSRKRAFRVDAKMARAQAVIGMAPNSADPGGKRGGSRDMPGRNEATHADAKGSTAASSSGGYLTNANGKPVREQQGRRGGAQGQEETITRVTDWWDIPRFARVDDGRSDRLDLDKAVAEMEMAGMAEKPRDRNARIVMTGNMQVPAVAALAWHILTDL